MKKIFFLITIIIFFCAGCTKDFLDINKDPNNPTEAPLDQLLTSSLKGLGESMTLRYGFSNVLAVYMHQITIREDPDQYGVTSESFYAKTPWEIVYTWPIEDLNVMINNAQKNGDMAYLGIGKILKAYIFSILVDLYGDVPYTEANKMSELNTNPKFEKGEEIYPKLLTLLDEAIHNLYSIDKDVQKVPGPDDLIYQGDIEKWIRLAYTIKFKLYNQIRLVSDVSADIQALLTKDSLMQKGGDFMLPYGTSNNPDDRNPAFLEYESGQKSLYMSPWFYEILRGMNPNRFSGIIDPRVPYYFYKQLKSTQDTREGNPTEYRDGGFVTIYFGSIGPNRDHSTDGSMTVLGIYPAGGRYDQGDALKVSSSSGTGDVPFRFLTFADFLYIQAELANSGIITANQRNLLDSAMGESFALLNTIVKKSATKQTIPTIHDTTVTKYKNSILTEFDAGNNAVKLEIIMTQKWIQSFGNSVDQYTDYRRTGYPVIFDPNNTTMAPSGKVTPPKGSPVPVQCVNAYPLSLPWSQVEHNLNKNAPAPKTPSKFRVFWDKD